MDGDFSKQYPIKDNFRYNNKKKKIKMKIDFKIKKKKQLAFSFLVAFFSYNLYLLDQKPE